MRPRSRRQRRPSTTTSRLSSPTASVTLLVGREDDPHAAAVAAAVRDQGGQPVVIDAQRLSGSDIVLDGSLALLADEDGTIIDLRGARGWLRRLAPEGWRDGVAPEGHEAVIRSAWVSTLVTIARLPHLTWLTPLDALFAAENKLAQQAACRDLGIATPPTVLVTRSHRIPPELGEWLVVKPMAAGHFRDETGAGRVVHATEMRRSDERLELLAGAPFLVQQRIRARTHLRVVTVDRQAWVCELDATDLPLDWRANEDAHASFTPSSRPAIASNALELAQRLDVGYSSQDWVIDASGTASFLDLNPAGQWLFLPAEITRQATSAIASWLLRAP